MSDIYQPDDNADDCDDFCEHIAKIIQLLLERRGLRNLRRDALVDATNGSVASDEYDHGGGVAGDNSCPREEHVDLVLLDRLHIFDGPCILAHALALASKDRLV